MLKRYVVLPPYGFRSETIASMASLQAAAPLAGTVSRGGSAIRRGGGLSERVNVLDAVSVDGPRLVEMTPETELALRLEEPSLKIVPVVEYHTLELMHRVQREASKAETTTAATATDLVIEDAKGQPVAGARVIAFTNFRTRAGDEGQSGKDGRVRLRIKPDTIVERLYVYGPPQFWGNFKRSFTLTKGAKVQLESINLSDSSLALRHFRSDVPLEAGKGVIVGIIDTGIARSHPLLPNVLGGANMVSDETRDDPGLVDDWGPAKIDGDHGTHVAGIVGARPLPAMDLAGVAPGVGLRSYRVFPHAGGGATNYDIMSAIDRAVQDGCHILNLSLGGGGEDEAVRAAIGSAMDRGVIVVAAAGNDGRKPVSFPAALPFCVAVSAMGWKGSFPDDSTESGDIAPPYGTKDKKSFVAAFSNFGPQIDLTGPGTGIVSTLPSDSFGAMSGTSMACPAVAGYAAFLLGSEPTILNATGENRSKQLLDRLYGTATELGFGRDYEGFGLPSED